MKKILLVVGVSLFSYTFAQTGEPCGYEKTQGELERKNPEIRKARLDAEAKLLAMDVQKYVQNQLQGKSAATTTVYEVPVVVHLMNDGTTPLKTDAEIITWIDNANKYFATTFGAPVYTVAEGNTIIPIKLVLAKRSPNCTTTTGINQINVTATYPQYSAKGCNSSNTDGVSDAQLRALSRWDPQSYYNMYIVNTFDSAPASNPSGLQGYAGAPTNPDDAFDTFMKATVVTSSQSTLPHEFAHSMGIHHPFRNGSETACPTVTSGGCATDNDMVCDTPSTKNLLSTNPLPANGDTNPCDTAGWNNVQFNIMNYTSSPRMFTVGQKDRGIALFLQYRKNLTKSLGATALTGAHTFVSATTCTPPATPTNTGNFQFGPTLVKIGAIDNTSSGSNTSNNNKVHYDYTTSSCISNAFKTTLSTANNPQTLTVACQANNNTFSAWIDYNNSGTFESNELIVTDQVVTKDVNTNFTFNIPTTGVTLNTPLRMRVIADGQDSSTTPCGQLAYGQVEDYEVTIVNTVLGTTEIAPAEKGIKIYPNPAKDGLFYIMLDKSASSTVDVTITDAAGRQVLKSKNKVENNFVTINSNLKPGLYFVNVNNGGKMISEKLIVK